jgi:hypothetical protein
MFQQPGGTVRLSTLIPQQFVKHPKGSPGKNQAYQLNLYAGTQIRLHKPVGPNDVSYADDSEDQKETHSKQVFPKIIGVHGSTAMLAPSEKC